MTRIPEPNTRLVLKTWLVLIMLWGSCALAAPFSADTHDVYPGDFNGDGRSDLLVIAKDPAALSGIYVTDASGQPSTLLQSWDAGFLGISWHESRYTAVIGNFDGVHGDDVLLQARRSTGNSTVILSDAAGQLTITAQSFANDHLGFKWSVANALVHAGDFNGDGRDDLLIQAKPDIALVDLEDLPIPVPVFKSNAFGLVLATSAGQFTSIHDVFGRKELGLDFAPGEVDVVIGDFNGDGREDILLLARKTGKSSAVVLTDGNGQLTSATVNTIAAGTLGANVRSLAADFNGDRRSEVYRVASTSGGANTIASFNSSGGLSGEHHTQSALGRHHSCRLGAYGG